MLASRGMAKLATGVGEVEHEAGLGVTQLRPAQNQAQALFAPSCVTRHRARSKFLDQDTDQSDASRRVNNLIFTRGPPAGGEAGHPAGRMQPNAEENATMAATRPGHSRACRELWRSRS